MGMGYYPCTADVIEEDFVKEVCPNELAQFKKFFEDNPDIDMSQFAAESTYEDLVGSIADLLDDEEQAKEIVALYDDLCTNFQERTGLELYLNFHAKEDRGDEVDGVFWCLIGVYAYTLAGEKYKDKIVTRSWTVYG